MGGFDAVAQAGPFLLGDDNDASSVSRLSTKARLLWPLGKVYTHMDPFRREPLKDPFPQGLLVKAGPGETSC
jgi:hypothetical protein